MSDDVRRVSTPLDFLTESDDQTTSWQRGDPRDALIQSTSRFGWDVTVRGGETHRVVLACEGSRHVGRCDCDGYRWHDGPCAHLCALYRAHTDRVRDADGDLVSLPVVARLVDGRDVRDDDTPEVEPADDRARADGGRVVEPVAGADGRTFGRPEGQL